MGKLKGEGKPLNHTASICGRGRLRARVSPRHGLWQLLQAHTCCASWRATHVSFILKDLGGEDTAYTPASLKCQRGHSPHDSLLFVALHPVVT